MSQAHVIEFFSSIQRALSTLIEVSPLSLSGLETLCGLDVSYRGEEGVAAAAVWSRARREITESAVFRGGVLLPYIPGLLYAREAPLMLAALKRLSKPPDLLVVDGHGLAHPRRAGLASLLGLLADRPSIGVAKSILHGQLREEAGREYLEVGGERVGIVFRDERGRRHYLSLGHRVDLQTILGLVEEVGHELLNPLREAHRVSKAAARSG